MVLSLLKRLLGGSQAAEPQAKPKTTTKPARDGEPDVRSFVEFVVCSLVDAPDDVTVRTVENERQTTVEVACQKPDIGKVIGKGGKTISAIRTLASGAGGRQGKRIMVEVLD